MANNTEIATIGGGCFWCLDAIYQRIDGVIEVESGYAGGEEIDANQNSRSLKESGYAEVVRITYNSEVISYSDILEIFWHIHDPTTLNQQGNDKGPQYRSIILYENEEQKNIAEDSRQRLINEKVYPDPIVTEIAPMTKFYKVEDYHQNFYNQNRDQPYCRFIIDPKVKKFFGSKT